MFLRCTQRKKNGKPHRYWSIVENRRVAGGRVVQRHVLYLGEINDSQREAWRKTIEVFEDGATVPKTMALMSIYFLLFSLLSGYLLPLDLLPGWIAGPAEILSFRYMLGVPVELLTRPHTAGEAAALVAGQLGWAAAALALAGWAWRRGVRRYEAVGG